ncbi:MAG: hypothetical protein WCL00_10055, partial [Bacteroidota bacterium]
DLAITKTDGASNYTPGMTTTYTIVVTNNGTSDVTGATVSDTKPSGVTWSWTSNKPSNGTGNINETVNLPAGATITYTVVTTIPSSFTGTLTNTAVVAAPSGVTDGTQGNNSATDNDSQNSSYDLSITKTCITSPISLNSDIEFKITVQNNGPSDANTFTVTDAIPSYIYTPRHSPNSNGPWTNRRWKGDTLISSLASGSSASFYILGTLTIHPEDFTNIVNTAIVSNTNDPNTANNSSTVTITNYTDKANLSVVKTCQSTNLVAGQLDPVQYTIVVSDPYITGNSDAYNVVLTDQIPSGMTGVEFTTDAIPPLWNTWTGSLNIGEIEPDINPTRTYFLRGYISSSFTGTLTNTASVTSSTNDPDLSNNTSTVSNSVSTSADLSITKTCETTTVVSGNLINYNLKIDNNGPSDALAVTVTDNVPSSLINPQYNNGNSWVTWPGSLNIGTLAKGGEVTIQLRATVSSNATGNISNTASVISSTSDPSSSNNSSEVTKTTTESADLSVLKTIVTSSVYAGMPIEYSIVVTNNGPSDATGVSLADVVESYISLPKYSTDGGSSWPSWTSPYSIGSLAAGSSVTILLKGNLSADQKTTVSNTAIISAITTDPVSGNNSSTASVLPLEAVDIAITKTCLTLPLVAGQEVQYSIKVENLGPSDAYNIVVTDVVPSGLSSVKYSSSLSGPWTDCTGNTSIFKIEPDATYPDYPY